MPMCIYTRSSFDSYYPFFSWKIHTHIYIYIYIYAKLSVVAMHVLIINMTLSIIYKKLFTTHIPYPHLPQNCYVHPIA